MKHCVRILTTFAAAGLILAGCSRAPQPCKRILEPGETVYFIPNEKKMVALTFDDGPNGTATRKILDVLKDRRVRATFFLVGMNVQRDPLTAKRIADEGHLVGNHAFSHARFDLSSPLQIERDIRDGAEAIEQATGVRPRWFRPPFGINGTGMTEICRSYGTVVAGWSLDANDWNPHPVEDLAAAIVDSVVPGDIILLHDGAATGVDIERPATVSAVPVIISALEKAGFAFVTVDELLLNAGSPAAEFANGVRLLGLQTPSRPVGPGRSFGVRYFWDIPAEYPKDAPRAFVHFVSADGEFFFQDDHPLTPRSDVRDLVTRNVVRVPRRAAPGQYGVQVGLFNEKRAGLGARLKVFSNHPQRKNAVLLPDSVTVVSPSSSTN